MTVVWRLLVGLPLLSGIALLSLLLLPDPHASVLASSQLPESPARHPDSAMPLLSPLLAAWLLRLLPAAEPSVAEDGAPWPPGAAGPGNGADAGHAARGPAGADVLLSRLSRSSSPRLSLCRAPACGETDMLVVTLLHRRVRAGGGTHDRPKGAAAGGPGGWSGSGGPRSPEQFVGVVEQWARPAAPFAAGRPHRPASETLLTAAQRGGDAGATQALLRMLRRALAAPVLAFGHTEDLQPWRVRWTVELPGPAQVSGRGLGRTVALDVELGSLDMDLASLGLGVLGSVVGGSVLGLLSFGFCFHSAAAPLPVHQGGASGSIFKVPTGR